MRLTMRCFGVLACLTLVLGGCSNYTGDIGEWKAPVLSKDWKNVVELRANVDFGDQLSDKFSTEKALTGFVFDAHRGARVTVTLEATNGDDPVLLLYGPLDNKGIWGGDGKHIALDHDTKDGRKLKSRAGKEALQSELTAQIQEVIRQQGAEGELEALYFTSFVMQ